MTGFFVAVIVGAILSTFNSALNSAATIFSVDFYQRYINPDVTERRLVYFGRACSLALAVFAIGIAPFIANAPDGLYQLLQQLNGIFFIPIASVLLAGFFVPQVSAIGAKAGLIFGLIFYVLMYFVLEVDMHFVHIWGIEFILNMVIMILVSQKYLVHQRFTITDVGAVEMVPWKYAKLLSIILVLLTIIIYVSLGSVG